MARELGYVSSKAFTEVLFNYPVHLAQETVSIKTIPNGLRLRVDTKSGKGLSAVDKGPTCRQFQPEIPIGGIPKPVVHPTHPFREGGWETWSRAGDEILHDQRLHRPLRCNHGW
jgi:hypothetical protein